MSFHEESIFLEIIHNGKFFFPAWRHYGNPNTDVRCDRCFKTNLVCAIGYHDRDLCLDCTEIICNKNKHINSMPPFIPVPKPLYPHPYITRMAQDIFKPNLTFMSQDFFKK
jgi:hypothetical protein